MDLFNELQELTKKLNQAIKSLNKNGQALAKAEQEYKILLRQEALKLRQDENMAVTLINQIIYGIPSVAEKRFKRDIAEVMYQTNQEYINSTKLKIRILEGQIQREWSNTRN